jgi:hypothetical protein
VKVIEKECRLIRIKGGGKKGRGVMISKVFKIENLIIL